MINISEETQDISVPLKALGLGSSASVYDLYTHKSGADVSGTLEVKGLKSHDSVFYKMATKQQRVVA